MRGRGGLPREHGVRYVAFCDPSGGTRDSMTLAIAHATPHAAVLDLVLETRPPFSPSEVVARFAEALRDYGIRKVTGDRYAGEWPREAFRKEGVSYEPSERTKSELYAELLPLLNNRAVELLDEPRLAAQLGGLERRTAWGGRDSIDHAPNAHDDVANAAAGALVLAARLSPRPFAVAANLPANVRHVGEPASMTAGGAGRARDPLRIMASGERLAGQAAWIARPYR
jgi:hypothetical protein